MAIEIKHDRENHRFLADVEGKSSHLIYSVGANNTLDFKSTYVPEVLRGRGIAAKLVRVGLDYARDNACQVIPTCWYVADFIRLHPEYQPLVAATAQT